MTSPALGSACAKLTTIDSKHQAAMSSAAAQVSAARMLGSFMLFLLWTGVRSPTLLLPLVPRSGG